MQPIHLELEKPLVQKVSKPIGSKDSRSNKFSIKALFEKKDEDSYEEITKKEELKTSFSEEDLHQEWQKLLTKVKEISIPAYNALHTANILLPKEFIIHITFDSASSLAEFEKVRQDWMKQLEKAFQNNCIQFELTIAQQVKSYVLSKEEIYQKLVEKNPLVEDLRKALGLDLQ